MPDSAEKTKASTGQDCPQSGVWQALGTTLPPLLVAKGDIMPAAKGRVVTWVLLQQPPPPDNSSL